MPGHKKDERFSKLFPIAFADVTELPWSDNLACPGGVIAAAQRDIAQITGARRAYILTDGSTCGVMTMLYAAAKRGSKVIVPRNSHQSVWNACRILGLEPVIVQGEIKEGIILPPPPEVIEKLVSGDKDISGLMVTSPDYYGNIAPLGDYSSILSKYGRLLFVDGAHGAHLAFGDEKKGYAGVYADIWTDGAHKTLFTLTQGAVLNVNNAELIGDSEEGLGIFRTTSPSYPIMASVEFGYKWLANHPEALIKAQKCANRLKENGRLTFFPSEDWTKAVLDCKPLNLSADGAAEFLQKRNLYCEFSDGRYILFYLSPATGEKDIKALEGGLKSLIGNKKIAPYTPREFAPGGSRTYSFQYSLKRPSEWVDLESAAGRMCACNAGITPPCIPVCVAGEIITKGAVRTLKEGKTFGLNEGKIKVVKQ